MTAAGGHGAPRRGGPIAALTGLVFAWVLLRAASLTLPDTDFMEAEPGPASDPMQAARPVMMTGQAVETGLPHPADTTPIALLTPPAPENSGRRRSHRHLAALRTSQAEPAGNVSGVPDGHRPVRALTRFVSAAPDMPGLAAAIPVPTDNRREWSADAWLVLREGRSAAGSAGELGPVYGGSQAGAVLRYSLASGSPHRPAAYLRGVQALGGGRDSDLAAGLSARPLAGVPVTAQAEVRATRRMGAVALRPAVFATAGIDDAALPQGFTARGYAQAGYVGGRDATAFADGSLLAERAVLRDARTALAAGVGLWGGAQRGAARLDLGPSAGLRFPLGEGAGRIAVDYRVRIAGNAAPAAGAALTLSTGF